MADQESIESCNQHVRAIKTHPGDSVDDLKFDAGDVIHISKKNGAGLAYGSLPDGSAGWFPLEIVELVHNDAAFEVPSDTHVAHKETALDAFIKEAKEKGAGPTGPKRITMARQLSLINFLNERPMKDQLVAQHILPSSETAEQISQAQKRLLKSQKKRKKTRVDQLVENLGKGWFPTNDLDLTEDQINRIATEILMEIPLSKQKSRFSTYDDVFTGATLLQHLKGGVPSVLSAKWSQGFTSDTALALASNLIERNIIFNVVDPSKTTFKGKNLYQMTNVLTDYSVLNLNKVCAKPASPINGYELSIQLIGMIVEVFKKYLPDFDALRKSKEFRAFGLSLSELQIASLVGLSTKEQQILFVNLYNSMVLYTHGKFNPPTNTMDRKFLYENCLVYTNGKKYSVQDLETKALEYATKDDFSVYFCLSDCTKSTPATFLLSTDNYDVVKVFAARHFLNRALIADTSNYEMQFPKMFQRVWKDLKLEKEELVNYIQPFLAREIREEIDKIKEIGQVIEVKFQQYSFEPSYVFEEASLLSPR